MNENILTGIILILPVLLVRFLLLSILNKDAVKRAAFFPPVKGIEKIAYLINILTTFLLLILPFFLKISLHGFSGYSGIVILSLGFILYIIAIIQFSSPETEGFVRNGLYRISRNPMYVAFFLYFLGCCLLTSSWLLLIILSIFQVSVHYLILSEERWCINQFGESYSSYMKKVRRYI
jgi:protein-S-isoprenylcysteine O-methyltransferase Ste14